MLQASSQRKARAGHSGEDSIKPVSLLMCNGALGSKQGGFEHKHHSIHVRISVKELIYCLSLILI